MKVVFSLFILVIFAIGLSAGPGDLVLYNGCNEVLKVSVYGSTKVPMAISDLRLPKEQEVMFRMSPMIKEFNLLRSVEQEVLLTNEHDFYLNRFGHINKVEFVLGESTLSVSYDDFEAFRNKKLSVWLNGKCVLCYSLKDLDGTIVLPGAFPGDENNEERVSSGTSIATFPSHNSRKQEPIRTIKSKRNCNIPQCIIS